MWSRRAWLSLSRSVVCASALSLFVGLYLRFSPCPSPSHWVSVPLPISLLPPHGRKAGDCRRVAVDIRTTGGGCRNVAEKSLAELFAQPCGVWSQLPFLCPWPFLLFVSFSLFLDVSPYLCPSPCLYHHTEGRQGSSGGWRLNVRTTGGDCRNVAEKSLAELFAECGVFPSPCFAISLCPLSSITPRREGWGVPEVGG